MGAVWVAWAMAAVAAGPAMLERPAEVEELCRTIAPEPPAGAKSDPVGSAAAQADWQTRRRSAIERPCAIRVPARQFHFREYRPSESRLTLDDRWALVGAQGAIAIYP